MTLSFAPERIEPWPLERLKPYARNAKTHGADQVAKIAGSMAQFGWTVPVLVAGDGEVIAGHGRILAADAARADRGAGDRARPPDRGAAAGLPAGRQQADRARRLGRGAARRRAAGAAGRGLRPVGHRLLRRRARRAARRRSATRTARRETARTRSRRRRPTRSAGRATSGCSGRTGCSAATPRWRPTSSGCSAA